MSKIEKDYSAAVADINAKISAAGKLIAEAGKIGKKAGIEMLNIHPYYYDSGEYTDEELEKLQSILDDVKFRPLLGAMDSVGWATSSLYC